MEKSENMSKNENREIRGVLIHSFELKEEKLTKIDKSIKQIKQELGISGD